MQAASAREEAKVENVKEKEKEIVDHQEPWRYRVQWKHERYYDEVALEDETRRIFDVCNGCRRCFNLCQSFPNLFSLIDESSERGDLASVDSLQFAKKVVDECTLCDMCSLPSKCPYTPPHELNIDFARLMLRHRAVGNKTLNRNDDEPIKVNDGTSNEAIRMNDETIENVDNETNKWEQPDSIGFYDDQLAHDGVDRALRLSETPTVRRVLANVDLVGTMATGGGAVGGRLVNKALRPGSAVRRVVQSVARVHRDAPLPDYADERFGKVAARELASGGGPRSDAPAFGRRSAVLYSSCLIEYHKPGIGLAALRALLHAGVDVRIDYAQCCGMPQLEHGDLAACCKSAHNVAASLRPHIEAGRRVITAVASCALMMKNEWPSIVDAGDDADGNVRTLADNVSDIAEYLVELDADGLLDRERIGPLPSGATAVTLHHACHARAQQMGAKSRDLLAMVPELYVDMTERCSGHGGTFGIDIDHYEVAHKVGKPVVRQAIRNAKRAGQKRHVVASDCPLALDHIADGIARLSSSKRQVERKHPIELFSEALC
jgi:glycerol-3-phosphate dehydrogenase subunit C